MAEQDIRWKQRFHNFEKSLQSLEFAIKIKDPDIAQKAGLIQFFEVTFELSWNLLRDFLQQQGFNELRSPRDCIKKAFETQLITDGKKWLIALESRNISVHTYDEQTANKIIEQIRNEFYPLLLELYNKLKKK
ncbi:MAG: nucleotidyltransferase substrate binding protein, partial [Cyclobacteriaceae bacterium]